jgi:hypothetical protein
MYEPKDMTGTLFRNEEKGKGGGNAKWPDYKGSVAVGGVSYWLSGWVRESKNGRKYIGLALTVKEAVVKGGGGGEVEKAAEGEELPF